jgi:hypothetical protein
MFSLKATLLNPITLPLRKYWKSRNESENGEMSRKKIKAFSRYFDYLFQSNSCPKNKIEILLSPNKTL